MSLFFPKEHKAKLDYKTAIKVVTGKLEGG